MGQEEEASPASQGPWPLSLWVCPCWWPPWKGGTGPFGFPQSCSKASRASSHHRAMLLELGDRFGGIAHLALSFLDSTPCAPREAVIPSPTPHGTGKYRGPDIWKGCGCVSGEAGHEEEEFLEACGLHHSTLGRLRTRLSGSSREQPCWLRTRSS